MVITSKWLWPGIAAAAAVLATGTFWMLRSRDERISDLPEEPVSSYAVRAEDVQLKISVGNEAPAALPPAVAV